MGYWEVLEAFEAKIGGPLDRGFPYALPDPSGSPPVPAAYRHQLEALLALEHGSAVTPPASGILHLPTGAGKTRVALELVARTLSKDPNHRFLWATDSKLLIQQTMARAIEFASRFPNRTRIAWYEGDPDLLREDGIHLTFLTRTHLRSELAWAHDARSPHPWRARLDAGHPLTLIYDECHQLGAEGLQKELRKFYEKVIEAKRAARRGWRIIGLSATPVPTREEARGLLRQTIFPLHTTLRSAEGEWGMHVFYRAANAELIREGILCRVNTHHDKSGVFDIPHDTLRRIAGDARVKPPGPNAPKDEVVEYALKFNRAVMGHDTIVGFLAEKLARNLDKLGKTIVFVPSIDVANRLVAALSVYPKCAGKIAAVHSKMSELRHAVPGQEARTPEQVLAQFKRREAEPCILVNVEMLTEGFDDPKVRTVVLAKLTLSTNRFWQMIGRGTRGPKVGGTSNCFVIDPIKLVRLYDYFAGYQPSVSSGAGSAIEDELEERGAGALDPSVPTISLPPLPSSVRYEISPELRRTHARVAQAIDSFLGGARLGEQEAIDISRSVRIASEDGAVVARPGAGADTAETGPVILEETLGRMSAKMQNDFAWLDRQLPPETSDDVLRFWIRKLKAIEKLVVRTEEEYTRAEMDGRLARELAIPVSMAADAISAAPATATRPDDSASMEVACLCAAVARADGVLLPVEVEVSARVVGRLTGAVDTQELRARVSGLMPTPAQCRDSVVSLGTTFDAKQRKALLRGLLEVAASDGVIHPDEVQVIASVASGLDISRDYVDALVDAREP